MTIDTDWTNDTPNVDKHPDQHNLVGATVNDLSARLLLVETGATRHTFTASGSLTADAVTGAKKLLIHCWGGGGAGGGCAASGTAPNVGAGGGGGGGGYAEALVSVAALTFPLAVTVGPGGVGVSNAAGGAGGTSSVIADNGSGTVLARATGGNGGAVSAAPGSTNAYTSAIAGPGAGNAGDLLLVGGNGGPGFRTSDLPVGGAGGVGALGGPPGTTNSGTSAGLTGRAPGGGGGGGVSRNNGAAQAGGDGGAGLVQIFAIY